jgi:hypothetical protein
MGLKTMMLSLLLIFCIFTSAKGGGYTTEDVFVPSDCESIAKLGDHILLEYTVLFANGSAGATLTRPSQLYHVLLQPMDDMPVYNSLKGMCENSTRKITWEDNNKLNLEPLFLSDSRLTELEEGISILLTVVHITTAENYQIFGSIKAGNISHVLDLIDMHLGVNAVDEWGQTALMIAVANQNLEIISALLNTRMPKVNVNLAKSSGFTAVFYAVEKASHSILGALLRRGADPNVAILQDGSKGNTPLHFACMLEKTKHMELLLEYGANPSAINQHGQTPLQLLPLDAVRSTKLYFKKSFEDAYTKLRTAAAAAEVTVSSETYTSSNEL